MTQPAVKVTGAKAVVAAVGGTLTALTTALATVSVVVGDDAIDITEVGALVVAGGTLVSTVYGVWKTRNKPVAPTAYDY